jgi:hypothetical protein
LAGGLATTARTTTRSGSNGQAARLDQECARGGHCALAGRGGAAATSSPMATANEGLHDGHQRSEAMAPDKVVGVEAHQGALLTTRGGGGGGGGARQRV